MKDNKYMNAIHGDIRFTVMCCSLIWELCDWFSLNNCIGMGLEEA